jgi:hypothetical protein
VTAADPQRVCIGRIVHYCIGNTCLPAIITRVSAWDNVAQGKNPGWHWPAECPEKR